MIISHKYKFIFLKTAKTAGTSIEISLSRYCGEDDIITTISPTDELIRKRHSLLGAQNFLKPINNYTFCDWWKFVRYRNRVILFHNHMKANDIVKVIGENIWNNYFKFCFVRHPYDFILSAYHWYIYNYKSIEIDDFIKTGINEINRNIYQIDGEIAVDKIFKYEELISSLNSVGEMQGFKFDGWLPMAKSGIRKNNLSLNETQKIHIYEKFRHEFEAFDYER